MERNSLKTNWLFPISAGAFCCLNATLFIGYIYGIIISFILAIIIAIKLPSIWDYFRSGNIYIRIISALSTIGICLLCKDTFYKYWSTSSRLHSIESKLPFSVDLAYVASIVGAIVSTVFVYICLSIFWKNMLKIVSETSVFKGITSVEIIIYAVLIFSLIALIIITFTKTDAFYGTRFSYDVIYTSDSPSLVKGNVYLALTHPENDLRQPLFAVFAAPFTGIPYLISRFFQSSASIHAILLNCVQVLMLITANFILAKILKLTALKRICFMVVTYFTYTQLLFTVMMEQYIVAYFWLILCIYLICENQKKNRIALWGAGGTILTSMILLPFLSEKSPFKNFKEWFMDMIKYGLEFVALMLVFCRFDVLYNLSLKVTQLSAFTEKSLSLTDKLYQYTAFIKDCFFAPKAMEGIALEHISWQLNLETSMNFIGVAIFALCVISTLVNRDKKSSLFAAGWICFSIVMLLCLGWGIRENGLILYALYFGWAYLVLIFQLVEKIETKMKTRILIPIFTAICVVIMAVVNIPAIVQMIQFAINYYPV